VSGRPARARLGGVHSDLDNLLVTFNEGTDLACVLVSASYLDDALAQLLEGYLIRGKTSTRLLETDGAIGGMGVRADVAYSLGLLSKPHYCNCRTVAEVRNLFAHTHKPLGFTDEPALSAVRRLQLPSLQGGDPDGIIARMAEDPRAHYTMVAAALCTQVLNLGLTVERRCSPEARW